MVGGVSERVPVVGFEQVIKEYLAREKDRRIIKKNVNIIMDARDFQESNSIWHSKELSLG